MSQFFVLSKLYTLSFPQEVDRCLRNFPLRTTLKQFECANFALRPLGSCLNVPLVRARAMTRMRYNWRAEPDLSADSCDDSRTCRWDAGATRLVFANGETGGFQTVTNICSGALRGEP
jgi:hypothetical protein